MQNVDIGKLSPTNISFKVLGSREHSKQPQSFSKILPFYQKVIRNHGDQINPCMCTEHCVCWWLGTAKQSAAQGLLNSDLYMKCHNLEGLSYLKRTVEVFPPESTAASVTHIKSPKFRGHFRSCFLTWNIRIMEHMEIRCNNKTCHYW